MSFKRGNVFTTLLVLIGSVLFFAACEREYNTIGVDLVDNGQIQANKKVFDVYAYNKKLEGVRTNGLASYKLGSYTHPVYGVSKNSFAAQLVLATANPTFGSDTQAEENADTQENERVTSVYLNIPFFSTALSDTTDLAENEPRPYRVDSIIGNRSAQFTLKVQEFTKYLRDLDPDSDFQEAQEYFSNEDGETFATTILFEDTYQISEAQIVIPDPDAEDDPDTEEDESLVPLERLTPRIRVELDPQFFQEKILDNEGSSELISNSNFREFLRGIYVSAEMPNNDLAMLLNVASSYVEIKYDYDTTEDDEKVVKDGTFKLNLKGNNVNYFTQDDYPSTVTSQFTDANAERLYPNGGAGSYVELDMLAGGTDITTVFQEAIAQGWLINEANLIFYVDEASLSEKSEITLPWRLYLYDLGNETSLTDYRNDVVGNTKVDSTAYSIYDGFLDTDNEEGPRYRFRLTEYINNLVRNDSTNVKLALTTTNNIANVTNVSASNESEEIKIPQASITNFYGTVLYGNNVPDSESNKRLQLEIYYTETK